MLIAILVVLVIVALYALNCIKILKEYERAVVYTFGRVGGVAGPGLIFVFPPAQTMTRVSLRQEAMRFRRRTSSRATTLR